MGSRRSWFVKPWTCQSNPISSELLSYCSRYYQQACSRTHAIIWVSPGIYAFQIALRLIWSLIQWISYECYQFHQMDGSALLTASTFLTTEPPFSLRELPSIRSFCLSQKDHCSNFESFLAFIWFECQLKLSHSYLFRGIIFFLQAHMPFFPFIQALSLWLKQDSSIYRFQSHCA